MACVHLDDHGMLISLLFLAACLVAAVRSFRSSGGERGGRGGAAIPSPPALPVIGNLHQLGKDRFHRTLQALARRHGPLFLLRLGAVRVLVVSSATMAEAVLKEQDDVFCSRPQPHTVRGTIYDCHDVGFCPYGERWRQLRRVAAVHLLSAKRVDSFRALREEEVASFLDRIRAASCGGGDHRGGGIDVSELIISLTNIVVSRATLGRNRGSVEPGKFRDTMIEFTNLLDIIAVSDVFPRLGWVDWATGLDARIKRMASKLDDILEKALREHEKSRGHEGEEARDFMDDLLSIVNDGGGHGYKLDRIDIKGLTLDMFAAGTDTIYKTIEWTMAELIKNPTEMAKVQAEVRRVAGAEGGRAIAVVPLPEEKLGKMTLLKAAMKEALRLHPPLPLLVPREAIRDTELHGYHIPAKTRVLINAWAIGRDGEAWEDAGQFRPERFVVHEGGAGDDHFFGGAGFRFVPFGGGRRGCPGVAFGTRLAELALANMVYHFDWVLPDGQDVDSFQLVEATGMSPGLMNALVLAAKPLKFETIPV
ncbi:hypothetical protein GUJ93_ZPchr0010g7788 [Zizania palustris]|uniref:Cytochrome P450 n=1 Tax=Zizania palustris TaxID=103762 RepID=A0A8J6BNR8_ZIZPA|nr:hypothetical protein GUJ93_ZPchr0010g7788 [Zizania palustris]